MKKQRQISFPAKPDPIAFRSLVNGWGFESLRHLQRLIPHPMYQRRALGREKESYSP